MSRCFINDERIGDDRDMHKKYIAASVAAVLSIALLVPVAYACGGHGRVAANQLADTNVTACAVCTVEDCQITGRHSHEGTLYCGYQHADGICDGTCRALCPVEGCDIAGYHTHDNHAYCGSHHEAGFCDGSCQVQTATPAPVNTGRHHGHRGHH